MEDGIACRLGRWSWDLPFRDHERVQRALRLLQLRARPPAGREAQSVTLAEAKSACDILKRNGVKFVHFTGG